MSPRFRRRRPTTEITLTEFADPAAVATNLQIPNPNDERTIDDELVRASRK